MLSRRDFCKSLLVGVGAALGLKAAGGAMRTGLVAGAPVVEEAASASKYWAAANRLRSKISGPFPIPHSSGGYLVPAKYTEAIVAAFYDGHEIYSPVRGRSWQTIEYSEVVRRE